MNSAQQYPTRGSHRRFTYEDLTAAQCHELLGQRHVGRIAWTAADGPQLFPISYVWHDDNVIFRTSPYGVLSELVHRTAVVFEVDDIDQNRRLGWSILVRGRAVGIAPDELTRPSVMSAALPWASGHRNLIIAVAPDEITGRRFLPLPGAAAPAAHTRAAGGWTDELGLDGEFP
ncbi:MAG TPA: pyridoxamine 5'-phosphate oxidase family protein [Microlunatus sp.]|nr:pyridoxamine 5'-phosphate oxidase family protein [Microlunatus sp.]